MTLYNIHEQQFSNLSSFLLRAHNRNPPKNPSPQFPSFQHVDFIIFFFRKERRYEQIIMTKRHVAFAHRGGQLCWQYVPIYSSTLKGCSFPFVYNAIPLYSWCVDRRKKMTQARAMSADCSPAPVHTYNCQARVQVPNPLSQQAPNPDSKVRPSLKNPKTQFFGLGLTQ